MRRVIISKILAAPFSDCLPSGGSSHKGLLLPEWGPGSLWFGFWAKTRGIDFREPALGCPWRSMVCLGTRVEANFWFQFFFGGCSLVLGLEKNKYCSKTELKSLSCVQLFATCPLYSLETVSRYLSLTWKHLTPPPLPHSALGHNYQFLCLWAWRKGWVHCPHPPNLLWWHSSQASNLGLNHKAV